METQLTELIASGSETNTLEIEQKQPQNVDDKQHEEFELDIDITNPMEEIKQKYNYCSEKICRTIPKLSFVFITALFILLLGNIDKFKSDSTNTIISVLAVVLSMITILLAAIALIYGWFEAKTMIVTYPQQLADISKGLTDFQRKRQAIYDQINTMFGIIVDRESLFSMDRTKFGITFIGFIIYATFNILLIESVFPLSADIDCEIEEVLSDPWIHGKCLVNQSSISHVYIFVYALFISASGYYNMTSECYQQIISEREQLENKIKNTKIDQRYHKLEKVIQTWYMSQQRQNRKLERISVTAACIVYEFVSYGIIRNEMFSSDINGGAVIFSLYLYIGDAVLLSIVMFMVHEQIFYFYSLPKLIMEHLSFQFKAANIRDIMLWWELRKYYLYCVIQMYTSGMSGSIFVALFGSVITSVYGLLTLGSADTTISIIFLFWTLYILYVAFYIVSSAVNFHLKECSHFYTINKEQLRLNTIQYYQEANDEQNMYDQETTENVFDIILCDIKENNEPIRVFGIAMNREFMLFLRASVVTISLAVYFGS